MKSEITRAQTKEFVPIELKIKIESKEELAAWIVQLHFDLEEVLDKSDTGFWYDGIAGLIKNNPRFTEKFDDEAFEIYDKLYTYYEQENKP